MADLHNAPSIELEVKDFGPIVHGKVDLRPMTVFIGPSNTGKSYLAILLYALHRFFSAEGVGLYGFSLRHRIELPNETAADLQQLAQAVSAMPADGDIGLSSRIMELLRSEFDEMGSALVAEIIRCFGMSNAAMLVRKGRGARASFAIRHDLSGGEMLAHALNFDANGVVFQSEIPQNIPSATARRDESYAWHRIGRIVHQLDGVLDGYQINRLTGSLMTLAVPTMFGSLRLPAYYFPVDRTGVMHAHSAIVSAMIGNASLAGLQPSGQTPMLSGVTADFLRQLIEMERMPVRRTSSRRRQRLDDPISQEIEKSVLQGSVEVERSELINYPRFTYRPDGWKTELPLMNAASMISEIAPIVLYLRHIVRPGNVLIIDEPESHLHPAMQVEFTRQLARLVQHGYRVIITTHSEWVLEELGNVVQRSQLPEKERAAVSESDVALTPEQVGVWLFRHKRRPRGSEVVEVRMGESGLYETGFDDVAVALSNDGANIFDRIGGNR